MSNFKRERSNFPSFKQEEEGMKVKNEEGCQYQYSKHPKQAGLKPYFIKKKYNIQSKMLPSYECHCNALTKTQNMQYETLINHIRKQNW
jgi:hypothetical protein